MEKLSLQEFQKLKDRLEAIYQEILPYLVEDSVDTSELTEEEQNALSEKFEGYQKEIDNTAALLKEHDLSEIPFEAWDGFKWMVSNFDLEGTGANIDITKIKIFDLYAPVKLKGCNVRNFDFENIHFDEESFDPEFIEENIQHFSGRHITDPEAKKRYYAKKYSLEDVIRYGLDVPDLSYLSSWDRQIVEKIGLEQAKKIDLGIIAELSYDIHVWVRDGSFGDATETLGADGTEKDVNQLILARIKYEIEQGDNLYRYDGYAKIPYVKEHLSEYIIDFGVEEKTNDELFSTNLADLTPEQRRREELLSNYKSRYLKLNEVLRNYDMFRGKKFVHALYENVRGGQHLTEEQIEDFYKTYEDVVAPLLQVGGNFGSLIERCIEAPEEERTQLIGDEIKRSMDHSRTDAAKWFSIKDLYTISKYRPELSNLDIPNKNFILEVFSKHTPEQIEEFEDITLSTLETSNLEEIKTLGEKLGSFRFTNPKVTPFIDYFTIENLITLQKETDGMFQGLIDSIGEQASNTISRNYKYHLGDKPEYEKVESAFVDIIQELGDRRGFDYSKYRGAFAERHPELYLPENAPEDLAKKFYTRRLTMKELREHPEWHEYFLTSSLSNASMPHLGYIQDKEGYSNFGNQLAYLEKNYPREEVLKFAMDFGVFFDNKNVGFNSVTIKPGMSWEEVKAGYYKAFKEMIKNGVAYDDNVPQDFKEQNQDMFFSDAIPEDVKTRIYSGDINLDDIRNVPGLYEEMKTKDMSAMMGKFFNARGNLLNLRRAVGDEQFLDLAKKYGYYLENSGISIVISSSRVFLGDSSYENVDLEKIEKEIQDKIREKIESGNLRYGPDAPEFFKEERPDLFLAEDAPELLKLSFYGKYISKSEEYYNYSGSNYLLKFADIEKHPEWIEFLRGKSLDQVAYVKQRKMYEKFDFDTVLKFIETDCEALTLIAEANAIGTFSEFYHERSEYFAWKEMKDVDGIPQEVSAPAVLGTEPTTPEQIEAKKLFDKKVEKFKIEILRNPGLFIDYPQDKLGEFNFGEYKELKKMSGFKNSPDYRRDMEENIIAHMYGFLGYSEAKKMLQLPNLTTEEIERLYDEQKASFEAVYEKRFKLKGNVKVLNTFFEKFEPTLPGGKSRLEIYKAFNKRLEEGYEGDLQSLLLECFNEAGIKPDETKLKLCTENAEAVHTIEKMSFAREEMYARINAYVQENPADKKILFDNLFAAMKDSLSKNKVLDKDFIEQYLKTEFSRVKEDGSSFYSAHVTEHIPELLRIVDEFNNTPEISSVMNASTVDLIKTEKQKIGNNWIRKARTISDNLTVGELEELEEKLYGKSGYTIDYTKHVELRNNTEQGRKDAYELLKKDSNPMLLTYAKAEKMFNSLTGPYSPAFVEFFIKHKEEFMSDPKYYTILKKMNDNFDSIMDKPHNRNRAAAGKFTVAELERVVNNIRYENVQVGEYELEYAARLGGLNPQYFSVAQSLFKQMKERTHQTIPQVDITRGRFRGRILRLDDPLHLMVGDITDCCQAIGTHAGEASMIHSATEKNGSVFVIEEYDEHGNWVNTVAQSWTWRNGDRICFDNVEIPDSLEDEYVQNGTHNELFEVYREAAKMLLENDRKAMQALLESGKITKAQHDILVAKDVTMGTGCDDLIKHLTGDIRRGLKTIKIVKPVEEQKLYNGVQTNKDLWIDSKNIQYVVASMEPTEREKLDIQGKASIDEIPLQYTRTREVISRKGIGIHLDIMRSIRDMKQREGDESSFVVTKEIEELEDVLEYQSDAEGIDNISLNMNTNEDWFILSAKTNDAIRVLDTSIVPGKFGAESQKAHDQALARIEYGQAMQKLILEAADTKKKFECTIDDSEKSNIFRELAQARIISITDGTVSLLDREALVKKIDTDRERIEKDTVARNLADVIKQEDAPTAPDKDDDDER